jgi:hypothetical protein
LAREGLRETDFLSAQANATAAGDCEGTVVEGILELGQAAVGARGRGIELGRVAHVESLVRALSVEGIDELIEPCLLLQEVLGRGFCGLSLEGQVHALVASVLLRVAGLDALDVDTQA